MTNREYVDLGENAERFNTLYVTIDDLLRGIVMSYKIAGITWNDDGSLDFSENVLTADKIQSSISEIHISDSIENLHINYKGKEYKFNLEKALSILADAIEDKEEANV